LREKLEKMSTDELLKLKKILEAKRGLAPPNPGAISNNSLKGSETEIDKMDKADLEKMIESTFKRVLKEQEDERERLRQEQRQRAEKYGISPKEGGSLTKPGEYENIPEDQFADPVNYRYPIDADHVRAALTYFNQPDNRSAGGYNHEEQVKIMTKIVQAALSHGIQVSWQPEDPVYRDLPEGQKSKLAGYEKVGVRVPIKETEKQNELPQNQLTVVMEQKKALEGALKESEAKIKALEERLLKKSMGEAVVNPIDASTITTDLISKKEILTLLPERVPTAWGYGPYELVMRIKRKLGG